MCNNWWTVFSVLGSVVITGVNGKGGEVDPHTKWLTKSKINAEGQLIIGGCSVDITDHFLCENETPETT